MSEATILSPAETIPIIGQPFEGGFFLGVTVELGVQYLNITAGAEHELVGAWGKYDEKPDGANSFTDSRSNTEAMAASGSEIAQRTLALVIGGFSDWAIPARDVQELQYRHFKPSSESSLANDHNGENPNSVPVGTQYGEDIPTQTSLTDFQLGGTEAFKETWYWSSSQFSDDFAFFMHFVAGTQGYGGKANELRVRPVRRLRTQPSQIRS